MRYPKVLSEEETLERIHAGLSIARYGDGELRIAAGGGCTSQRYEPRLTRELRKILGAEQGACMVGIPRWPQTPNKKTWTAYTALRYTSMYTQPEYASSFITRPDNAPWIDVPGYWARVEELWVGKDITLVLGDKRSLRPEDMAARSLREVWGPSKHAYEEIDRIEEEIGEPSHTVLLCLGACATALAWRLADKGVHAVDIGHIGMFMRHAGAYKYKVGDLISPGMIKANRELHARPGGYGGSGHRHAEAVLDLANKIGAKNLLDYGCGEGTLAKALKSAKWSGRVMEYDPAVSGKDALPKFSQLLVCTDVLEHVEPAKFDNVMAHLHSICGGTAYIEVACRPSNKKLKDGRNSHLIIEPPEWWRAQIERVGFEVMRQDVPEKRDRATYWLKRR